MYVATYYQLPIALFLTTKKLLFKTVKHWLCGFGRTTDSDKTLCSFQISYCVSLNLNCVCLHAINKNIKTTLNPSLQTDNHTRSDDPVYFVSNSLVTCQHTQHVTTTGDKLSKDIQTTTNTSLWYTRAAKLNLYQPSVCLVNNRSRTHKAWHRSAPAHKLYARKLLSPRCISHL